MRVCMCVYVCMLVYVCVCKFVYVYVYVCVRCAYLCVLGGAVLEGVAGGGAQRLGYLRALLGARWHAPVRTVSLNLSASCCLFVCVL